MINLLIDSNLPARMSVRMLQEQLNATYGADKFGVCARYDTNGALIGVSIEQAQTIASPPSENALRTLVSAFACQASETDHAELDDPEKAKSLLQRIEDLEAAIKK